MSLSLCWDLTAAHFYKDALNANTFFNNATFDPSRGANVAKPVLRQHFFGFNLGGPVWLPKKAFGPAAYDGRNRSFWFFSYEGFRENFQATRNRRVLTPEARQGIFRYTGSDGQLQAVNLLNAGNFKSLNPVTGAQLNAMPPPNNTLVGDGLNTAGYRFNVSGTDPNDKYVGRYDQQLIESSRFGSHKLEFVYNHANFLLTPDTFNNLEAPFPGGANAFQYSGWRADRGRRPAHDAYLLCSDHRRAEFRDQQRQRVMDLRPEPTGSLRPAMVVRNRARNRQEHRDRSALRGQPRDQDFPGSGLQRSQYLRERLPAGIPQRPEEPGDQRRSELCAGRGWNRRMSKGLQMQANYTFSKALTDTDGNVQSTLESFNTLRNLAIDKHRASFDQAQRFAANFIYELPFGPGRQWLNSGFAPLRKAVEGWQVGSIIAVQTGPPISITSGRSTFNQFGAGIAQFGSNIPTTGAQLVGISFDDFRNGAGIFKTPAGVFFFDPKLLNITTNAAGQLTGVTLKPGLLAAPAPGTFGNFPRNSINGPRFTQVDLSLTKRTRIYEKGEVEFKLNFINAFNHPNFIFNAPNNSLNFDTANFGRINTTRGVGQTTADYGRQINFILGINF